MATCSTNLVWEIPRTEEPGGLQSMGWQKSWTQLSDLAVAANIVKYSNSRGSPSGSGAKNLPTMQETRVPSLGWEDPLEEERATCFSILTGKSPEQRSLGATAHGSQRVGQD